MELVLGGKNRDRWVEEAPEAAPFWSRGTTWRGEYHLPVKGWYVVLNGKLSGPFLSKSDAKLVLP